MHFSSHGKFENRQKQVLFTSAKKGPNELKHTTDLLQLIFVMKIAFFVNFAQICFFCDQQKYLIISENHSNRYKNLCSWQIYLLQRLHVIKSSQKCTFPTIFNKASLENDCHWIIYVDITNEIKIRKMFLINVACKCLPNLQQMVTCCNYGRVDI